MKKIILDNITRKTPDGSFVIIDCLPCPSENSENAECLSKAMDYYRELYPGDYIDVSCCAGRG